MLTEHPWPSSSGPCALLSEQPSGCPFSRELSLLGASTNLSFSLSLCWGRLPWGVCLIT